MASRFVRTALAYLGIVGDESAESRQVGTVAAPARQDRSRSGGLVVVVVFVPREAADRVRRAAASAGAGAIGDYRACSFSAAGEGRFEPQVGARPTIGRVGEPEVVDEMRVEMVVPRCDARRVVDAVLAAHPYEEPAWHAYETLGLSEL